MTNMTGYAVSPRWSDVNDSTWDMPCAGKLVHRRIQIRCYRDERLGGIEDSNPLRWAACTSSLKGCDAGERYATIAIVPEPGFPGSPIPAHIHKLKGVGTEG